MTAKSEAFPLPEGVAWPPLTRPVINPWEGSILFWEFNAGAGLTMGEVELEERARLLHIIGLAWLEARKPQPPPTTPDAFTTNTACGWLATTGAMIARVGNRAAVMLAWEAMEGEEPQIQLAQLRGLLNQATRFQPGEGPAQGVRRMAQEGYSIHAEDWERIRKEARERGIPW